ncbi:hypothetical protein DEA8626_02543 [Defluviimonas aquaemixtae]|uniref:YdhG-like domain-containing protein n=1 Tax=Albidovulum aquaemixtae TaxID=1542388 RepID=A0A2R8BJ96_9RHOB|nr:DUF1801 domain-containing protein [Defluviimonas aquaemixtae]SPH23480.1 hypothetical protein DEA8626_02543 [Defluviimonas aquaemixtae]
MTETNPKVEAFFANAKTWREELLALRAILLDCPVSEEFKWRSPCYTYDGGNVATLWGMKDHCVLSFFKGVLLKDPHGILVAPGKNSRSVRLARLTSVPEIAGMQDILKDYIREAVDVEKAGLKVDFPKDDLEYPDELTRTLRENPEFRSAFEALTPGRQRGYVLHFARPKQSATRSSRIDRCLPRILDGKGMHDR